jgi:hypothetical protein
MPGDRTRKDRSEGPEYESVPRKRGVESTSTCKGHFHYGALREIKPIKEKQWEYKFQRFSFLMRKQLTTNNFSLRRSR